MDLLIAPGTVDASKADTAPATGTPGWATDGDPVNQIARTVFPAYAYNALLAEIYNVIVGAKLTPDRTDNTQLFKAISQIAAGSESAYFLKSGDTAAWVTSDGWVIAGNSRVMSGGSGANGAIQVGDYVWSDGITAYGYGKMAVSLSVTDVNGKGSDYRSGGLLQFTAYDGTQTNFYFSGDDYIYDPSGNKFLKTADLTNSLSGYLENYNSGIALALPGTSLCVNPADGRAYLAYAGNTKIAALAWNSDLAAESSARAEADTALQNSINGKQPAGNYIIGLSGGKLLQDFVVAVDSSGVHNITLPQALSAAPTSIAISHGLTNGSNASVSVLGGWTETGFQIQTNGATSVNFIISGIP
ncbi:hypothetical protein [Acetobacter ascendens]|uniref:hypothetical protein n=1 Tax=Acetobacter ascendens TaxID=481146 RepID=UPI000875CCE5|nr:hypothetical protein [Acetobacter ascendens]AOW49438.1 hypothetical protein A4R89_08410 [Acetobacter ascendens]